jgi:hypothetical protein
MEMKTDAEKHAGRASAVPSCVEIKRKYACF